MTGELRFLILCYRCMDTVPPDRIAGVFEAKYGFVDEDAITHHVLACPPWNERNPRVPCRIFICDGDGCGAKVAVARSSRWFVDLHRQEHAR